jgi:hypothetical protein
MYKPNDFTAPAMLAMRVLASVSNHGEWSIRRVRVLRDQTVICLIAAKDEHGTVHRVFVLAKGRMSMLMHVPASSWMSSYINR